MDRNKKGQFVSGHNIVDLTGQRFGKLTVIEFAEVRNKRSFWKVKCDCGNEKIVRNDTLKVIVSCGCVKKEQDIANLHYGENNHGMTKHKAFVTWCNMMNRCYSEHNTFFKHYGGRGIKVCEEWHDVKKFCKWADETGYRKGLTIERIEVNGNYEPSNCKWITMDEQALNKRNTFYCEIDGEKIPAVKLAKEYGIPSKTIKRRYKRGIRNKDELLYKGNLKDFKR